MSEVAKDMLDLKWITDQFDRNHYNTITQEMSFEEYILECKKTPKLIRTASQRILDMILEKGNEEFKRYRRTHKRYKFFQHPEIPIFGLEEPLEQLVEFIKGAAGNYGPERRVLLLHGPVGSSKSTICSLLKKGLEEYTETLNGALYTYRWVNLPCEGKDSVYTHTEDVCAMNQDPIKLIPLFIRENLVSELNAIMFEQLNSQVELGEMKKEDVIGHYSLFTEGDINPRCLKFLNHFLKKYNGDMAKVFKEHIRVQRLVLSEKSRIGIATFQPKDEKNQDSTELTGDINFAKIGHFGKDSDPCAFNFDGELCVGERGIVEFIEVLKLAKEFLYDLLGVSQEHNIKPKKFAQISVDEFILSHTNAPEFKKLQSDPTMEALRDRTVKIDIPYLLKWSDERKIYEHCYRNVRQHVMPHTFEIAAFWAILTRLHDSDDGDLDLQKKVKLYDGKSLPGFTEDKIKELRDKYPDEGMNKGVSARYVQDKIANCLARHTDYINVFMVLDEIKKGLKGSALISNPQDRAEYEQRTELAVKELDDILKNEVQKALVADEEAIIRLCDKYIDNLMAYVEKRKVINPITQRDEPPDERLMRAIEQKIKIPEQGSDDFRRSIMAFIGGLSRRGEVFRWDSNPELKVAFEKKIFEDTKDHIKLSAISSQQSVVDKDLQEKIDAIKARLIKQYGYNEKSAQDVLNYVSSIFARGDIAED